MTYHIVTGDCLAEMFPSPGVAGEIVVVREALVDGPVSGTDEPSFWEERAKFLTQTGAQYESYFRDVKGEFDRIGRMQPEDKVYLWFENDLFCQVNYWFTITLLVKTSITRACRVMPLQLENDPWSGFAGHKPEDLKTCFDNAVPFARGDFKLGQNLWDCYRQEDIVGLTRLASSLSPCFPHLAEVCKAEAERKRNARPRKVLEEILSHGYTNFNDIFAQFSRREAIYGFGDVQVGHILKSIKG